MRLLEFFYSGGVFTFVLEHAFEYLHEDLVDPEDVHHIEEA